MPRFRVKAGIHVDENGKVYRQGDIVHSDDNLTEFFREKFVEANSPEAYKASPIAVAKENNARQAGGEEPKSAAAFVREDETEEKEQERPKAIVSTQPAPAEAPRRRR